MVEPSSSVRYVEMPERRWVSAARQVFKFVMMVLVPILLSTVSGCTAAREQSVLATRPYPDDVTVGELRKTIVAECLKQKDAPNQKELRNTCVNHILLLSDMRFEYWRGDLRKKVSTRQTILDAFAIGLATAGAVTSMPVANILSASSAGVIAINRSWDVRVLAERTLDSIIAAIQIVRAQAKQEILTNLAKEDKDYSLSAGVAAALAYDSCIGLDTGIAELTKEANTKLAAEQDRLQKVTIAEDLQKKLDAMRSAPGSQASAPATPPPSASATPQPSPSPTPQPSPSATPRSIGWLGKSLRLQTQGAHG